MKLPAQDIWIVNDMNGKEILIPASKEIIQEVNIQTKIISINPEGLAVATGQNVLLVKEVHLESAKPMDAASFARGHRIESGFKFE